MTNSKVTVYMSFRAVFESYSRINQHLQDAEFRIAYNRTYERLHGAKSLFLKWLDLYRQYAKGYSQELLKLTSVPVIRMLSICGVVLEEKFLDIFDSKIPSEAYILIDDMFWRLGHEDLLYVVVQGGSFEQSTIYSEVEKATLGLSPPGPETTRSVIDVIKADMRTKDTSLLYYERGQYDNPLAWPLLLHEGFHRIYYDERLDQLEDVGTEVSWLQEALIDMYLMHFFGPAYAASSAIYLMRFPHLEAISHPHFIARLYSSLLYLTQLMNNEKEFPARFKEHLTQTFNYVKNVWDQYKNQASAVQKSVEEIYNKIEGRLVSMISSKTRTFSELLLTAEQTRLRRFNLPPEDYLDKELFSVEDVLDFYEKGLPIAVDPRIFFNSFISGKFLQEGISKNFVIESLKKWHIKKTWSVIQAQS